MCGPITYPFEFMFESITEVNNALKRLDKSKAAGPDKIEPFLKLAADFIAEPLSHIFNLGCTSNTVLKFEVGLWSPPLVNPET